MENVSKNIKKPSLVISFLLLLQINFKKYRTMLAWFIPSVMVAPIMLLYFMKMIYEGLPTERVAYIITGNMIFSLLQLSGAVAGELLWLRTGNRIEYFSLQPINKVSFLLSLYIIYLIFIFPTLIIIDIIGNNFFRFIK